MILMDENEISLKQDFLRDSKQNKRKITVFALYKTNII